MNIARTIILLGLYFATSTSVYSQSEAQPNIIFIVCDDLDISGLGAYDDTQAITPYLDSLSNESFVYTNAHANATMCAPSRSSIFTGVLPATSGQFGYSPTQFDWQDNEVLSETATMFRHFKDNGYKVYASGKIFHGGRDRLTDFDDLYTDPFQGPFPFGGGVHSDLPELFGAASISFAPLENIPSSPEGDGWYVDEEPFFFESDENRDLLGDEMSAVYLDSVLAANSGNNEPLFITLGMYSPHQPFHAPQKYFDLYPLDSIDISQYENAVVDEALAAYNNRFNAISNTSINVLFSEAPAEDSLFYLKQFIQGYYAGVSFLDTQIGEVLKSIDEHGYADNTYVVFTSDHGYHLGSRQIIKKATLWSDATHIPLSIRGPGIDSGSSDQPVSLIDLYPTLINIAGIPEPDHQLDGESLNAILNDPLYPGTLLSVASIQKLEPNTSGTPSHQHHAILVGEYKYILYSSGEDELYNVINDPDELNDLSDLESFQKERAALYNLMASKVNDARSPSESYQQLFYGDFEQDLNGWFPSREDDQIQISQGNDQLGSKSAVLKSDRNLRSLNIKIDEDGFYELRFVGSTETGLADVRVSLTDTSNGDLVIFNEIFELSTNPEIIAYTFFSEMVEENLQLRIKKLNGSDVFIDDVTIFNSSSRELALTKCVEAIEMESNTNFLQIENDTLAYILNQRKIECSNTSTLSRQLWYEFEPSGDLGLIVCRTKQPSDPIIEVWEACDSDNLWLCAADRSDNIEYQLMDSVQPGQKYFVRIADSNKAFRSITKVTALYQDLQRASIASFSQTELLLNDITYPNFELEDVTFRFSPSDIGSAPFEITRAYNPSGIYSLNDIDLTSGEYSVRAAYTLNPLGISVPFGEPAVLSFLGAANELSSTDLSFSLYPNPVATGSNEIMIIANGNYTSRTGQIYLTDIRGKVLSRWENYLIENQTILNLPQGLSRGLYFIKITGDKGNTEILRLFL